jgi:glycosyltransferase involved in cell wall biosynthesis
MCRISIITALHNKGPYIAETINSVRCQTLADWEMIVVENGSTDDGPDVVSEIADRDARIRLIDTQREVRGPCGARNLGIEEAKGQWLLFLDADDWVEPDHLEILVSSGNAAGADVVAGGWKEFIEGIGAAHVRRPGPAAGATAASVLNSCLGFAPWAVHAALIRREWLSVEYRWPLEMERLPSEDAVFWFRLLHGAKLVTVPNHSAVYRKDTPGNRDAHRDLTLWMEAVLRVIRLNETFLHSRDLRPTPTQAAHVTRSLEALWRRCHQAGAVNEANVVESEVERWLKLTGLHPSLLLRRVIGIRGFESLRGVYRRNANK